MSAKWMDHWNIGGHARDGGDGNVFNPSGLRKEDIAFGSYEIVMRRAQAANNAGMQEVLAWVPGGTWPYGWDTIGARWRHSPHHIKLWEMPSREEAARLGQSVGIRFSPESWRKMFFAGVRDAHDHMGVDVIPYLGDPVHSDERNFYEVAHLLSDMPHNMVCLDHTANTNSESETARRLNILRNSADFDLTVFGESWPTADASKYMDGAIAWDKTGLNADGTPEHNAARWGYNHRGIKTIGKHGLIIALDDPDNAAFWEDISARHGIPLRLTFNTKSRKWAESHGDGSKKGGGAAGGAASTTPSTTTKGSEQK